MDLASAARLRLLDRPERTTPASNINEDRFWLSIERRLGLEELKRQHELRRAGSATSRPCFRTGPPGGQQRHIFTRQVPLIVGCGPGGGAPYRPTASAGAEVRVFGSPRQRAISRAAARRPTARPPEPTTTSSTQRRHRPNPAPRRLLRKTAKRHRRSFHAHRAHGVARDGPHPSALMRSAPPARTATTTFHEQARSSTTEMTIRTASRPPASGSRALVHVDRATSSLDPFPSTDLPFHLIHSDICPFNSISDRPFLRFLHFPFFPSLFLSVTRSKQFPHQVTSRGTTTTYRSATSSRDRRASKPVLLVLVDCAGEQPRRSLELDGGRAGQGRAQLWGGRGWACRDDRPSRIRAGRSDSPAPPSHPNPASSATKRTDLVREVLDWRRPLFKEVVAEYVIDMKFRARHRLTRAGLSEPRRSASTPARAQATSGRRPRRPGPSTRPKPGPQRVRGALPYLTARASVPDRNADLASTRAWSRALYCVDDGDRLQEGLGARYRLLGSSSPARPGCSTDDGAEVAHGKNRAHSLPFRGRAGAPKARRCYHRRGDARPPGRDGRLRSRPRPRPTCVPPVTERQAAQSQRMRSWRSW